MSDVDVGQLCRQVREWNKLFRAERLTRREWRAVEDELVSSTEHLVDAVERVHRENQELRARLYEIERAKGAA